MRGILLVVAGLALLCAGPAWSDETWTEETLNRCPEAKPYLADSSPPEAVRDSWRVSGSKIGTSMRFPEAGDDYHVLVEHLQAEDYDGQGLTGVKDGEAWMIWFDNANKACALLTGSAESLSGGGASLEASAETRTFQRGDLELVLTLDTRELAEDTRIKANNAECDSGGECKSGVCNSDKCVACTATSICPGTETCQSGKCKP